MTGNQPTTRTPAALAADKAKTSLARLEVLLPSLAATPKDHREAEDLISAIAVPASPVWIAASCAALFGAYFDRDQPDGVAELIAEDWVHALREFPAWAIRNGMRWWKSADNPERRKRPLEGDIAARCRREVAPIRAAEIAMARARNRTAPQIEAPSERPRLSPEERKRRAAILADTAAQVAQKLRGA